MGIFIHTIGNIRIEDYEWVHPRWIPVQKKKELRVGMEVMFQSVRANVQLIGKKRIFLRLASGEVIKKKTFATDELFRRDDGGGEGL